jgi:hypothetical protein
MGAVSRLCSRWFKFFFCNLGGFAFVALLLLTTTSVYPFDERAMGYQWQPLDNTRREIRVLDLDAGGGESSLRGNLRHISLNASKRTQYETVSYAWGERTLFKTILIGDKTMSIPTSAASALCCMRLSEQNRTLWIDCVCINQDDNLEKGQQVRLMADIYTSSSCTLAFIGKDEALGQQAFHNMTSLCNTLGKERLETPEWGKISKRRLQVLRDDLDWAAIRGILSMPYFGQVSMLFHTSVVSRTYFVPVLGGYG